MISFIHGEVVHNRKGIVSIMTPGGVGYDIEMSLVKAAEYALKQTVTIHTFLRVTDSSHTLFGFSSVEEKTFFELLLTVKGVGPKSALNILSLGSIDDIQQAIARADATYLSAVQGMGKKTAERLVVELKGKVTVADGQTAGLVQSTALAEAIEALVALGYTKDELREIAQTIDIADKSTEDIIKLILQQM